MNPSAIQHGTQIMVTGLPDGLALRVLVPQMTHMIVYKDSKTFKLDSILFPNYAEAEEFLEDMWADPWEVWQNIDLTWEPQLLEITDLTMYA